MKQFKTQCYLMLETTTEESGKDNHLSSFWRMTTTLPLSRVEKARTRLLGSARCTGAVTPQDGASTKGMVQRTHRGLALLLRLPRSPGTSIALSGIARREPFSRRSKENLRPRFLPSAPVSDVQNLCHLLSTFFLPFSDYIAGLGYKQNQTLRHD